MYLIAKGGIADYPKNTIEGVLLSKFDKEIDGVLIDVRMTNDGKLVLYENDWIFKNNYISKMKYENIKKINFRNNIKNYYIPLLEEILLYYEKDILVVRLHHNFDQNERLVNEFMDILNKYYIKKMILLVNNDNLYDYLKLYTNYEVYNVEKDNQFINIDDFTNNYKNSFVLNLYSNRKK